MFEIIYSYPYLFSNVLSLAVLMFVMMMGLSPKNQWETLVVGLANIPFGLLVFLFEGDYWSPRRLGGGVVGVEDILVSFVTGAGVWLIVALTYGNRLNTRFSMMTFLKRYISLSVICSAAFYCIWMVFGAMTALILTYVGILVFLLVIRSHLWPLMLVGALIWGPIYCGIARIDFWIWPDFLSQWQDHTKWGQNIFGLPVGEIVWSISFGAITPLIIGYYFDARIDAVQME
jgi:hypothetical protein